MFASIRLSVYLLLIMSCFLLSGCSDLKKAKSTVKKSTSKLKQDLNDIQQRGKVDPMVYRKFDNIYKGYVAFDKKNGKGPANWEELKEGARLANAEIFPITEAKKEGYTVVWNGKLKNLSEKDELKVLAYDSRAALNGGWVMFASKYMEKMSANDFADFVPLGMPQK